MKGFLKTAALALAAASAAGGTGCVTTGQHLAAPPCANVKEMTGHNNMDLYDPCWFERYGSLAQRTVNRAISPQVMNGHVLDQTVWNHYFEEGTARLTPGGQEELRRISRRRPEADRTVFLAASMDLTYDPNCPERHAGARQELDALRVAAVQKYLVSINAGRGQDFTVQIHDPADVTIHATAAGLVIPQMYGRYRGGLQTGAGGAAGGGGGAGFSGTGGAGR